MNAVQIAILKKLPAADKSVVIAHYNANAKKTSTAVLFALFLGGLGAHHFYLGRTVAGVLSLLLFWTFLPAIFALIEALFMGATVSGVNAKAFDEGLRMAGFGYLAK